MDWIFASSAILSLDAGPGIGVRISGVAGSARTFAAVELWRIFWLLDTVDSRNNDKDFEVFILHFTIQVTGSKWEDFAVLSFSNG